jgi:hypothetical protein
MLGSSLVYPDSGQIAPRHGVVDAAGRSVLTWLRRKLVMRQDGAFKSTI